MGKHGHTSDEAIDVPPPFLFLQTHNSEDKSCCHLNLQSWHQVWRECLVPCVELNAYQHHVHNHGHAALLVRRKQRVAVLAHHVDAHICGNMKQEAHMAEKEGPQERCTWRDRLSIPCSCANCAM